MYVYSLPFFLHTFRYYLSCVYSFLIIISSFRVGWEKKTRHIYERKIKNTENEKKVPFNSASTQFRLSYPMYKY